MPFPPAIAIATRNRHKIQEITQICSDWPVGWVSEGTGWPDVEETGRTYLDNALLKARAIAEASGLPSVADDSGIEVDALGGEPGVRSARFAGERATDAANLALLIDKLDAVGDPALRTGRYRCVAALVYPGRRALWAEGICEGRLIVQPRGSGGFGYDPVFVPASEGGPAGRRRTMAELSTQEKHAISHRGQAFRRLRALLAEPTRPSA
jgi:XTP/dITP diphosphohydrolase